MSNRALQRKHRVGYRTVTAALNSAWPEPRKAPPKRGSRLDPYRAIIDGWLRGDLDAPRKQRHTAKRIFDRLLDEHLAQHHLVAHLLLELGRLGLAALDGLRHQRLDARLGHRLAVDDGDVLRLRGQRRGEQRGERERSEAEGSGNLHGGEGHSGVARRAGVDGQGVDALGDQVAQGIINDAMPRHP